MQGLILPAMNLYAVITGATEGIGKAIAEKIVAEGGNIAVCARNEASLRLLAEGWKERFPKQEIFYLPCDIGRKEEVEHFASAVLERFERVDILVNNAGIFQPGQLATEPEGQLEETMAVNLFGPYHLTRALLSKMKQQQSGHIFNLCSVASLRAYENGGAYSISKYALLGFSENLREELREYSIKVTSICPGAVWSRSWSGSGVPRERIMEAEDIAALVWTSYNLSSQAGMETLILRPLKGDL